MTIDLGFVLWETVKFSKPNISVLWNEYEHSLKIKNGTNTIAFFRIDRPAEWMLVNEERFSDISATAATETLVHIETVNSFIKEQVRATERIILLPPKLIELGFIVDMLNRMFLSRHGKYYLLPSKDTRDLWADLVTGYDFIDKEQNVGAL